MDKFCFRKKVAALPKWSKQYRTMRIIAVWGVDSLRWGGGYHARADAWATLVQEPICRWKTNVVIGRQLSPINDDNTTRIWRKYSGALGN